MASAKNIKSASSKTSSSADGVITGILYQYELQLEKMMKDVADSAALHKIGEETPFVEGLKELLKNPLSALSKVYNKLDSDIMKFIKLYMQLSLSQVNNLAQSVYFIIDDCGILNYYILLKEDNETNRDHYFSILEKYEGNEISRKFIVNFHFIPKKFENKFVKFEKLDISNG